MIIGLTGLAGSGKSELAHYLVDAFKLYCVDLDVIGHRLLEEPTVIDKLSLMFGHQIIKDQSIDRRALGAIVFNNKVDLEKLNHYIHPKLIELAKKEIETASTSVLVVGSLLIDFKLDSCCDYVVGIKSTHNDVSYFVSTKQWLIRSSQEHLMSQLDQLEYCLENDYDPICFLENAHAYFEPLLRP